MLLETYNEAMAAYGSEVIRRRAEYLSRLAPVAAANYRDISSGAEVLQISTAPAVTPATAGRWRPNCARWRRLSGGRGSA